jgi:hypothetical protein
MGLAMINFGIDEFINPRLRVAGIGTKKMARAMRRAHQHGERIETPKPAPTGPGADEFTPVATRTERSQTGTAVGEGEER